jgi:hypothetical protein
MKKHEKIEFDSKLEFDSYGRKFLKWIKMIPEDVWAILLALAIVGGVIGLFIFLFLL